MKSPRPHLNIVGLQQRATLFIPKLLQGKNYLLESEHRKNRVDIPKPAFYSKFTKKVKLAGMLTTSSLP